VAIHQGWLDAQLAASKATASHRVELSAVLQAFAQMLQVERGLDRLTTERSGELVHVRSIELAAAINRIRNRSLKT
jgi:hypothetical protein